MSQLGDTRSDIISVLSLAYGGDKNKATAKLTEIENLVRQKAMDGTNQALDSKVPGIRKQVHDEALKTVKPLFIGATVAGGVGIALGLLGLFRRR